MLGIFLRNFAVRRAKDFKDTFIGLVIIWLLLHIISYSVITVSVENLPILLLSMLSSLAPVFSFAIISFLLIHLLKTVKDDM